MKKKKKIVDQNKKDKDKKKQNITKNSDKNEIKKIQQKRKSINKYSNFMLIIIFLITLIFLILENIKSGKRNYQTSIQNKIAEYTQQNFTKINTEIDIYSDNSLQKYVSEDQKINKYYEPEGLIEVKSKYLLMRKKEKHYLVLQAKNGLTELAKDFYEEFGEKLYITSTYRPRNWQRSLIKEGCSTARCASIGASEHQLGLAVDLSVMKKNKRRTPLRNKYFHRMEKNGYKYGFINTYKKGFKIDGKMKETWHWRYVGIKLAKYLYYKELSFAEFFKLNHKPSK